MCCFDGLCPRCVERRSDEMKDVDEEGVPERKGRFSRTQLEAIVPEVDQRDPGHKARLSWEPHLSILNGR